MSAYMPTETTRHLILGTAGHIDHGKTSLVRALTGTDTDRLPEERRRGMTIELGFAELSILDTQFGVVDVPGHERFVRTMVAGATGIDIAILVVAADDAVMPQTIEHVEVLQLLGVKYMVVALTKTDMVDEDTLVLAEEDVRSLLAATPWNDALICPVSSITGRGIEDLKRTLLEISLRIEVALPIRPFRLAIDRVFTIAGRGTVVTGSTLRGEVSVGDPLEILPSGLACKVRGLQTHGQAVEQVFRGQRAAVNLTGVDRADVERGCEIATPAYLESSRLMDTRIELLSSTRRALKTGTTVRLGIGTRDVSVRVVLLGESTLEPGQTAYAQIRCGEPLVSAFGQRFILRNESPGRIIGGGKILLPVARRRRPSTEADQERIRELDEGNPQTRLDHVLRFAGFTPLEPLQLAARAGVELSEVSGLLEGLVRTRRRISIPGTNVQVAAAAVDDLVDRLVAWVERYHRSHPDEPGRKADSVIGWLERVAGKGIARALFDTVVKNERLKVLGRFVCAPAFAPTLTHGDEKLLSAMASEFRQAGFQPPTTDALASAAGIDRKRIDRLITLAVAIGELVKIEPKMFLHAEFERTLRETVAALIAQRGPVTVAEIREALNSSRKYVVPFMEYLDKAGFTRRIGDQRSLADPSSKVEPREASTAGDAALKT